MRGTTPRFRLRIFTFRYSQLKSVPPRSHLDRRSNAFPSPAPRDLPQHTSAILPIAFVQPDLRVEVLS